MFDTLLGRSSATKKLESLLGRARAQLDYSMSGFQKEISQATSVVTELLKIGHHNNAYSKVDRIIKKQNYVDVYTLIIGYLRLLIAADIHLFEPNKDIPEELLEAVSSFLFAAPRIQLASCFTAIQDVRKVLLSRFGQNLAAQYLEMRDNCGINPQIIDKLSKEPSLREVRMKFLEELAAKENIVLKLEEASTSTEGTSDVSKAKLASGLSDPVKRGKKKHTYVAEAEKAVGNSSKGPENKESEQEGNDDGLAKRGKTKQKGKKKHIDVAEKAVDPENKESEQEGNDDGSAKRDQKKKQTDVSDAEKPVVNSSNRPENKKSEQKQEGNGDDGSAKRGKTKQKGKKKQIDDAEKALGKSSKDPGEGSGKRGKKKQSDMSDAEKALGKSSNDPGEGSSKRGKKKQSDMSDAAKALGKSSNGPENKKSEEEEEEGNDDEVSDAEWDVRSESTRSIPHSVGTIKLGEDTVELLEKDVDINWTD